MPNRAITSFLLILMLGTGAIGAEDFTQSAAADGGHGTLLLVGSKDSSFAWRFDIRVFLDAAFYAQNKNELSNGAELRKGRFAVGARLFRTWSAELDIDFADNHTDVEDAWISWRSGATSIKAGNFKEPFCLEEVTSSRNTTFMERSLASALAPGRHLGLAVSRHGKQWFAASGIFGREVDDDPTSEDQGYAITGRAAVTPLNRRCGVLHLGAAATRRRPGKDEVGGHAVRYRSRPETHVDRSRFLDTGSVPDVEYTRAIGVEQAACIGRLSIQSEYTLLEIVRTGAASDARLRGAYTQLAWLITGKPRPYLQQDAEFGEITPGSRIGAVEAAARYSWIDLNDPDAGLTGGEAEHVTIGVNWYPNFNIRLMCNFVIVNNDDDADGRGRYRGGDDFGFFQTRLQACF